MAMSALVTFRTQQYFLVLNRTSVSPRSIFQGECYIQYTSVALRVPGIPVRILQIVSP